MSRPAGVPNPRAHEEAVVGSSIRDGYRALPARTEPLPATGRTDGGVHLDLLHGGQRLFFDLRQGVSRDGVQFSYFRRVFRIVSGWTESVDDLLDPPGGYCSSGLYGLRELVPPAHPRLAERISLLERLERGYSNENLLYASSALHHWLSSFRFVHRFRGRWDEFVQTGFVDTAILFYEGKYRKIGLLVWVIRCPIPPRCSTPGGMLAPVACLNRLKNPAGLFALDSTDMMISRICRKVCFSECFYFSHLFRIKTGMSPMTSGSLNKSEP